MKTLLIFKEMEQSYEKTYPLISIYFCFSAHAQQKSHSPSNELDLSEGGSLGSLFFNFCAIWSHASAWCLLNVLKLF